VYIATNTVDAFWERSTCCCRWRLTIKLNAWCVMLYISILCVVKYSVCTAYPSIHPSMPGMIVITRMQQLASIWYFTRMQPLVQRLCTQATCTLYLCDCAYKKWYITAMLVLLGFVITLHTQLINNKFLSNMSYNIMHRLHSVPLVNSFTSVLQGRRRSIHEIMQIPGGNSAS